VPPGIKCQAFSGKLLLTGVYGRKAPEEARIHKPRISRVLTAANAGSTKIALSVSVTPTHRHACRLSYGVFESMSLPMRTAASTVRINRSSMMSPRPGMAIVLFSSTLRRQGMDATRMGGDKKRPPGRPVSGG